MPENPLLPLLRQHLPLPLDQTRPEHVEEAVTAALSLARERIRAICTTSSPPDFENTVVALEAATEGLDRVAAVFYHLLSVDAGEALQDLSKQLPPRISAYHNDVMMNPVLLRRLEEVAASAEPLSPEQQAVLEDHLAAFRRNGASLSAGDQNRLREIDRELSTCAPRFAEHVLKATEAYELWVSDPATIEPLPEAAKAAAKEAAISANRGDEWKFTLDAPSYLAFMTYAPDAELREALWRAYGSRCVEDEFQNNDLIRKILDLRHQRARLLGYHHHVHYTLERRMAGDLESLRSFYERLTPVVMPAARRDVEAVRALKERETGESDLHPWDFAHYSEKLRQETFELRQEELRPWFAFDATLEMLFELTGRLFGLNYASAPDLPVHHPDVRAYRITHREGDREIGTLIIDPFPRPGKRPGAWMNPLVGQGLWDGATRRPDVAIVSNVTPPTETSPSLLTLDEARTLFHEFGHALHELLSDCTYRSVAGTRVRWDFVELPSQLMENWLLEPEFLREFPRHHQTGEPLPESLIERIQAARTFQTGYQSARQISLGQLDLAWHTSPPSELGDDLAGFERAAVRDYRLFPPVEGVSVSHAFQHIFSGGYASGYYSYKWAEVLEADVFEAFKDHGLFDSDTSGKLVDCILSKGGSRPPEELFRAFRERDPDPDALLRRDGLL